MDGCFADPLTFDEGYPTVTRALNESGRHIVFSCSWPAYLVWGGIKVLGVKKRFITRKFLIQASPAINTQTTVLGLLSITLGWRLESTILYGLNTGICHVTVKGMLFKQFSLG